ncbi:hypothetical protein [Methanocaldococcus sp.]
MRKVYFIIIILFTSLSMCIDIKDIKKDFVVNINNTPVDVQLRTNIYLAKQTEIINTTPKEIYYFYHTKPNIYIRGSLNITPKEGGVTILDLITKIRWLNKYYPHNIIIELSRENDRVYVDVLTKDGKEIKTYLTAENVSKIINSNKTMVIEIYKTNSKAKITKIGNRFIIEGNSKEELDKAESRFIMAMLLGS